MLIRRPLLQREDGARLVGFELEAVRRFTGLGEAVPPRAAMEGCASPRQRCAPAGAAT